MKETRFPEAALELRRSFDNAFAEAPAPPDGRLESVLAVGLAGERYAVRLGEVAGLFQDRHITVLPSPFPEFLGVAGIQGRIIPVYELRGLLGHSSADRPRWILLAAASEPMALAFETFEGQHRVIPQQFAAVPAGARKHVNQAVQVEGLLRHVIDVASIVDAVKSRLQPADSAKER